jgi:hypothetical protein
MDKVSIAKIENMIYIVRGQKVMLDSDLAELYQVETKHLNRQVRRNLLRFPMDFMFQLSPEEYQVLKYQIGTSKTGSGGKQKLPLVFTENGIAMLSSVLNSDHAILINISIMRIFTKLRSFLLLEQELKNEIGCLKQGTSSMFKIVFERMDNLEELLTPKLPAVRKKIGLKGN